MIGDGWVKVWPILIGKISRSCEAMWCYLGIQGSWSAMEQDVPIERLKLGI